MGDWHVTSAASAADPGSRNGPNGGGDGARTLAADWSPGGDTATWLPPAGRAAAVAPTPSIEPPDSELIAVGRPELVTERSNEMAARHLSRPLNKLDVADWNHR